MAITQGATYWYKKALKNLTNSKIDFSTHQFKMALLSSAYTLNDATHEYYDTHITGELATGNGYTSGGQALTNVAWTQNIAGLYVFTCDSPSWSVSSTGFNCRSFVVYDDTPVNQKPLLVFGYHDYNNGSPRDFSPAAGSTFTVLIGTSGLFTAKLTNSN